MKNEEIKNLTTVNEQIEDVREFIELLIKLRGMQKERVKGIMIGMYLMDEKKTA